MIPPCPGLDSQAFLYVFSSPSHWRGGVSERLRGALLPPGLKPRQIYLLTLLCRCWEVAVRQLGRKRIGDTRPIFTLSRRHWDFSVSKACPLNQRSPVDLVSQQQLEQEFHTLLAPERWWCGSGGRQPLAENASEISGVTGPGQGLGRTSAPFRTASVELFGRTLTSLECP